MEEECPNETKCSNYQENHLVFWRSCEIYKKEWEIIEIKYKRNNLFLSWKMVESYMKVNTYATVARRANPISNSNHLDNYIALVK